MGAVPIGQVFDRIRPDTKFDHIQMSHDSPDPDCIE
jgi:hypothetical protein